MLTVVGVKTEQFLHLSDVLPFQRKFGNSGFVVPSRSQSTLSIKPLKMSLGSHSHNILIVSLNVSYWLSLTLCVSLNVSKVKN